MPARRSVGLAQFVGAPAHDEAVGPDGAVVGVSCGHCLEGACGRVGLAAVVGAPTLDEARCAQGAAVGAPCGDGTVGACGCVGLAAVVGAPAHDGAVCAHRAAVMAACGDGVVAGGSGLVEQAEGAGEKRRHLSSGHRCCRAVAQRVLCAARGDARLGERVDARAVGVVAGHVGEPRRGRGLKLEGPHQERRHLRSGHRCCRAVAQRVLCAADGDAELGEALDVPGPPRAGVDVAEA